MKQPKNTHTVRAHSQTRELGPGPVALKSFALNCLAFFRRVGLRSWDRITRWRSPPFSLLSCLSFLLPDVCTSAASEESDALVLEDGPSLCSHRPVQHSKVGGATPMGCALGFSHVCNGGKSVTEGGEHP